MASKKIVPLFLGIVLVAIIVFIIVNSLGKSKEAYEDAISVAQLLAEPVYDKKVRVYGQISLLPATNSLTSEGEDMTIGYQKLTIEGINNNDWVVVTGKLKKDESYDFWASKIERLKSDIHENNETERSNIEISDKVCTTDQDCIHFGKTGECNCGCYYKDDVPTDTGGECFCQAPTSCECVEGKCEGVFE